MTQKTITRYAFSQLAGAAPSTVTRACLSSLQAACVGKRIDPDHPAAVDYLAQRACGKTKPPATGVDPKYEEALQLCRDTGRWTASTLQRKLLIGYNRAKKILAQMEGLGLVPEDVEQPDTGKPTSADRSRTHTAAAALPPAASVDDITPDIPDEIAEVADMTLREVVAKYGTLSRFSDILRALKSIEDIHEKRLKNAQTDGTLVARKLVKVGIVDVFNSAHLRVMSDGAKTIAAGVMSKHAAGADLAEIEAHVSDVLGSFFKPVKGKIARALRNA